MPPATTRSRTDRRSRPERVAEAIKAWVVEQRLQPGDRLPSEPELIERFGMAKSTIREAMRLLEAQGLVRTRTGPGGGSFVHEVSRARAQALLGNYFYFKDLTIRDIYQLRRALEPELAASLAGKLSQDVLARLEQTLHAYDVPARTLEEERAQHVDSLRFHAILAEAAENELLGFIIGFMTSVLSDITVTRRLYAPPNQELWQRGRDYQRRLLMALREGDAGAARAIMKAHMQTAQALMEGQEAEMLRRFIPEQGSEV
ncbi:GntR family transcriptional regulator [Allgaiera indica]|uniref:GntR family transcriptional regulator n=1 Tax=Allgaiera indica TaxID=765699 RepID=A0AAN5A2F8_9RHOB|nr:FCD domain-containing protein [Allgaiera indica]GHE05631.1 GntR family transcriptional regulator [Allgaiera indica]SDX78119.1 transcriptional regulator, GntR family [Allgaiera indica]